MAAIVNVDVFQTHCWWCEAVASEGSSEQDILSCWRLSTEFIFSYYLIYKTFAKVQLQFHIKIMLLFAFFYTRTYSISKRSWGRRSNQVCPWERKFLCFLSYEPFLRVQMNLKYFLVISICHLVIICKLITGRLCPYYKIFKHRYRASFRWSVSSWSIIVLVLQTGQVHHNLQKPRPVPGPLSTQQPLAVRQRHVLGSQHEKVRPAEFSLASSSQPLQGISLKSRNDHHDDDTHFRPLQWIYIVSVCYGFWRKSVKLLCSTKQEEHAVEFCVPLQYLTVVCYIFVFPLTNRGRLSALWNNIIH